MGLHCDVQHLLPKAVRRSKHSDLAYVGVPSEACLEDQQAQARWRLLGQLQDKRVVPDDERFIGL
eukprot:10561055-Heterocapsa_arctica.AAC.1